MSLHDDGPAEANRTRARWALRALNAFGDTTGQSTLLSGAPDLSLSEDVLDEIGGDLLANLFHLARLNDHTPEQLISRGLFHFEAEVKKEQEDPAG